MPRCLATLRRALGPVLTLIRELHRFPRLIFRIVWNLLKRSSASTHSQPAAAWRRGQCAVLPSRDHLFTQQGCDTPHASTPIPGDVSPRFSDHVQASTSGPSQTGDASLISQYSGQVNNSGLTSGAGAPDCSIGHGSTAREIDGWTIQPVIATHVMDKRYDREHKHFAKMRPKLSPIGPGTTTFADPSNSDWRRCVHPEGALYFVLPGEDTQDRKHKIFTTVDVRDPTSISRSTLVEAAKQLVNLANSDGVPIESATELVLDPDSGTKTIRYYFVNHSSKCLFWVHAFETVDDIIENLEYIVNMEHAMEVQYWAHMEAFPYGKELDEKNYYQLRDMVLHASAERVSSDTSLSPYDADELAKIQGILDSLKDRVGVKSSHAVCVVARMSRTFARAKLYNCCGQPEARLEANESVHRQDDHLPHWIFSVFSFVMFGTPPSQLERLRGVWVDRSVNTARWRDYISSAYDEFTGLTLYSTVMIAVDVSFLAVPDVEGQNYGHESASTVCTYVSIIAAVGSMTLSLLLSADARRRRSHSADNAVELLSVVSDRLFGIETLAIMYSLPFSLLMWGMIFFLAGLCSRVFPSAELYTVGACIVALVTLMLAVLLPLYTWWLVESWTPLLFQIVAHIIQYLLKVVRAQGNHLPAERGNWPARRVHGAERSVGDHEAQRASRSRDESQHE